MIPKEQILKSLRDRTACDHIKGAIIDGAIELIESLGAENERLRAKFTEANKERSRQHGRADRNSKEVALWQRKYQEKDEQLKELQDRCTNVSIIEMQRDMLQDQVMMLREQILANPSKY